MWIDEKDLDVVDVSSSHKPPTEPIEASMPDVNEETTPEASSTLQKMNPIEPGQGTLKDISVHFETLDPQDKGSQSQSESSPLEKTTEQHEEAIPIKEVSSEHEHNDLMDFNQPSPAIQDEESSEEQTTTVEGLEKEKEKTPEPSPVATISKSSSYQVIENPPELELEELEEEDVFDILTKWSSGYSTSSKALEAGQNKPDNKEAFQQAYNHFQSLAFDENLYSNLRKVEYKKEIEDAIKRLEFFDNEFSDDQRDVMEQFLNIFNVAYKVQKDDRQCLETIEMIENETKEDRSQLEQTKTLVESLKKDSAKLDPSLHNLKIKEKDLDRQLAQIQKALNKNQKKQKEINDAKENIKKKQTKTMASVKIIAQPLKSQLSRKMSLEEKHAEFSIKLRNLCRRHKRLKGKHT